MSTARVSVQPWFSSNWMDVDEQIRTNSLIWLRLGPWLHQHVSEPTSCHLSPCFPSTVGLLVYRLLCQSSSSRKKSSTSSYLTHLSFCSGSALRNARTSDFFVHWAVTSRCLPWVFTPLRSIVRSIVLVQLILVYGRSGLLLAFSSLWQQRRSLV